jgi:hypothetical protein
MLARSRCWQTSPPTRCWPWFHPFLITSTPIILYSHHQAPTHSPVTIKLQLSIILQHSSFPNMLNCSPVSSYVPSGRPAGYFAAAVAVDVVVVDFNVVDIVDIVMLLIVLMVLVVLIFFSNVFARETREIRWLNRHV